MKLSRKDMRVLNKIAREQYGCKFNDLDILEQDEVFLYAEANWLVSGRCAA